MRKIISKFGTFLLLTLAFLLFNSGKSYAQTTFFFGTNKAVGKDQTGALYSVEIDRVKNLTYVKIEVIPTKKISRLNILCSDDAKIKAGDWESNRFLGTLSNDGKSYDQCDCYSKRGWSNPTIGQKYHYTLVFDGAIPPGLTKFSLEDRDSHIGCGGYEFRNNTLINFDNHPRTYLSELLIKQEAEEQNDGIVGIYEPFGKSGYKLGCIKDGETYKLVYLSYSGTNMSWWKIRDIKAILRPSATTGVFKAEWYMANKAINTDAHVFFDGSTMKTVVSGEETSYLKMYPTGTASFSSGTQKSSGTGFCISTNGIIVTNYHVIEDAKKITVRGVNSNFDKKLKAKVLVSDKANDLALIQIDDYSFTHTAQVPYPIKTKLADVGESIFVLGYPLRATMGDEIKLTNGIVSAKTGYQGDVTCYQISAPVQPGNSGGPLFDKQGNLIGIVSAKHTGAESVSYAIKTNYLFSLIELLPTPPALQKNNLLQDKTLSGQVEMIKKFVYIIETE